MASRRHLWAPLELDTKTFSEGERLSLYLRGQQKNHQIAFHAPILPCRPAYNLHCETLTVAHMCSACGVILPHADKCYGTPKTCVCRIHGSLYGVGTGYGQSWSNASSYVACDSYGTMNLLWLKVIFLIEGSKCQSRTDSIRTENQCIH